MIEYIGNEGKMMTNNFHTHTFRCLHAYGTEREYALEALEKYGALKGTYLALRRLLKCNPFHKGGYDPVP